MATLLSRNTWAKILVFRKNGLFLLQNVFILDYLARIQNQRTRIDFCAKLQLHWTKGISNFDLERYQEQLDDVILTSSDDMSKILWLLRDLSQSTIMPSLVVIGPQIEKKQRGTLCLYGSKRPQPE